MGLAALFSAINDARSLITLPIAAAGSVLLLVGWIALELIMRKHPLFWVSDSGQRVRLSRPGLGSRLAILGAIVLLWVPQIFRSPAAASITGVPSSVITPVATAQPNEVLILLAEFKNDSRVKYDIAGSIELAIQQGLAGCPNLSVGETKIRLEHIGQSFSRTQLEDVKATGRKYNAHMVIWGYYDDAGIFPSFTVATTRTLDFFGNAQYADLPEITSSLPNLDNLANPSQNLGLYVHGEVPRLMTYLTEYTLGQLFFLSGDWCAGHVYNDAAIETAQGLQRDTIKDTLESAYTYQGMNLFLFHMLDTDESGYQKAIEAYTKAIELSPAADYYLSRAAIHARYQRWDQVIPDVTRYLELTSQEGRGTPRAVASGKSGLTVSIGYGSQYVLRGKAFYHVGEYQRALDDLDRAVQQRPDEAEAYLFRAYTRVELGDPERALEDFGQAIALTEASEPNPEAYFGRGVIYLSRGDFGLALADMNKSIDLAPDFGPGYFYRGLCYFWQHEPDRAITDFTKSIELNPDDAESYYRRALALSEKRLLDEAIADYSRAIEKDPQNAIYYYDRAIDYMATEQYDAAIADCDKSLELDPSYTMTYLTRGQSYRAKGEKAKALEDLKKVLAADLLDQTSREHVESMVKDLESP